MSIKPIDLQVNMRASLQASQHHGYALSQIENERKRMEQKGIEEHSREKKSVPISKGVYATTREANKQKKHNNLDKYA